MTPPRQDILLSQRFLPEFGGSIRWMYEVYRRWPRPVRVITHDYYDHPPRTPEFPHQPARPSGGGGGDHVTDANLTMDRRDIFMHDWGLESWDRLRRYARMTGAVREQLRGGRSLIVHCTHAVPEVVTLLPLKLLYGQRIKIVCYGHGEEVTACLSSRQLTLLMHRANAAVDLMLVNSRYTAGVLKGHVDPAKVQVVHPGVELSEFADAAELGRRWRTEQGLDGKLVVLTVGRLDPRKNHAAVVESVARLAAKFPALVYVIASEGRQMESLKQLAAQRGVTDRVRFAGAVDTATKLAMYGGCDVFAMPAIRDGTDVEGFGMVFLEAGACGKPCLAGREGGQAEAVIDGQTGLVVDGTDPAAVAGALERFLADPALRRSLGGAGRSHAEDFDWPRVVQRTVGLVDNTM